MTKALNGSDLEEAMRLDALERQQITDTPEDENFDRVVRLACAATQTPIGLISLIDSERQWFKARIGMEPNQTPREHAFCAHAIRDDEVMVVEDATKDPRFASNPLVTCEDGIRFYAGAPLKTREGFNLGTLCVIDKTPRTITQRDKNLLADMAGIVVNEMELRRRVGTDALTGLYTRRFLDELAARELARARREFTPLTAAFIDADHFKSINDTYGHPAGDAVLRSLGPAIRPALRASDLLARHGGEELVLLLPGTTLEQSAPVLERVREQVSAMEIGALRGRKVTVSIGAAELTPEDVTIEDLLARADQALYRAKQTGRNRVELSRAA
ncbi:MAG: sensor domain-containing diguanylate cyclase [Alphaproteobacteria bacterium]